MILYAYYSLLIDWAKKIQTCGAEDMEFTGVLNKEHMEILGDQLKKEVEYPGVFMKNSCGISMGPGV